MSKVRVSRKGIKSGGCKFSRGALYELLANPIYIGEIRHKQERHPGQHEAILPESSGKECSSGSMRMPRAAVEQRTGSIASPLAGKLFDADGRRSTCKERLRAAAIPLLCLQMPG